MRIIISNVVTLNGGDYAILESMMKVISAAVDEKVEFVVYDNNGDVTSAYYPNITYKKLIYRKYHRKSDNRIMRKLQNLANSFMMKRFLVSARAYAKGNTLPAKLLLTAEQRSDLQTYLSADLIISTGGTYLVENYFLLPRIFDYNLTLALKKPLIFFTQSLGPFNKAVNKISFKPIFDSASLILLRDRASLNHLEELGVNTAKAHVCADVVFADADENSIRTAGSVTVKASPKVAISVREWAHFKKSSTSEGMKRYNESMAAIVEYVCTELDGEVTFVSTCQGIKEYRDDSLAAQDVYNLLSPGAQSKSRVNGEFHTPDQLKEIIRDFDLVISTRMHFAIQSLGMGKPVFPIAYEFKTKELFRKLMPEEYILDIDTMQKQQAVERFSKFITELPRFRTQLFENVEKERLSAWRAGDHLRQFLQQRGV